MKNRRVAILRSDGHAEITCQPIPDVLEGEVGVSVNASLISAGTELVEARQRRQQSVGKDSDRCPFGYQCTGIVRAVGKNVQQHCVGDRVVCMGAGYALHSEYVVVPQNLCYSLPDSVSYEHGTYAVLGATALQAIRRGGTALGEYLLVVGLGVVGHLAAQLARLSGMRVMGWDMEAKRLDIAQSSGIDLAVHAKDKSLLEASRRFTGGVGFDMAVLAIGGDGSEVLQQVKSLMARSVDGHEMGRVVMVGGLTTRCQWGAAMGNLTILSSSRTGLGYKDDDWEHGRSSYPPIHVRWSTANNVRLILDLIANQHLRVDLLTTHRFPLNDIDDAIAAHLETPSQALGTVLLME